MSAANQLPHLMTVAEFLDWPTPDGSERWELIDGTPEAMAPATDRHGAIHAQAAQLLTNHLDDHPRCRVLVQPGVAIGDYNLRMKRLRPDRLVRVRVGYRDNRIACTSYIHGLPPVSSILRALVRA